jgi:integrase
MGREGSGVEARDTSIRIKFVYRGETIRERLTINGKSIKPTPANLKFAHKVASQVRTRIEADTFEFADFFPDSPRVKPQEQAAGVVRLGELADTWITSKGQLAGATRDQYATAARFWKRLLGEDTPITELSHKVLASKIGGYPWPSAKTHNNYLIALRGILGLEFRGPMAAHSPMVGIENMTVVRKLPDPLSGEDRDAILADMRQRYPVEVYAYFLWQFSTGMRPEETIALRWSDLDKAHGTIRVQRVRTFKGSERDGSKTHTVRDVDLVDQALEALQLMRPLTSLLRTERQGDQDTAADIFRNPITKRPWHDERSQRDTFWRPSLKRLGIRWRTAYNTRHTYATVLLMSGVVPPVLVAQQLGHSVKMLLDRYYKWIPSSNQVATRGLLNAAVAQSKTGT